MLLRHFPKFIGVAAIGIPVFTGTFNVDRSKGEPLGLHVPSFTAIRLPIVSHCETDQSNKAKDKLNVAALHLSGKCTNNPKTTEPLTEQSVKDWARRQYQLGLCYSNGINVPMDMEKAANYFKLAADQGHAEAQLRFAICCEAGTGVPKDQHRAVQYLEMAAAQDHKVALFALGECYRTGNGVAKNRDTEAHYHRRAAELGHLQAQFSLGIGAIARKASRHDDLKYMKMAARQGHLLSAFLFGFMNFWYPDSELEKRESVQYLQFAAKHGEVHAQAILGSLTYEGHGVEQDMEEGLRLLNLSAEQGCAMGQMFLAIYGEDDISPTKEQIDNDLRDMMSVAKWEEPAFWKLYKW